MKEKKRGNVFSSLITKLRFITKTHISIINSKLKRNVLKIKKDSSIQFNNSSVAKSNIKLSGGSNAQIYGELYKCIIDICGTNNNLIIEEGCSLRNLTLIIKGTSCTIKIKKNTSCNGGCMICMGRANHINIGESCMFADNVDIWASDTHPIFNEANELTNPSAPIEIADNVWLGRHAKILKGVRIGEGAVIGMGAIVTKDITPRSLNAGIPAKCIKTNIRWNKGCIADFE